MWLSVRHSKMNRTKQHSWFLSPNQMNFLLPHSLSHVRKWHHCLHYQTLVKETITSGLGQWTGLWTCSLTSILTSFQCILYTTSVTFLKIMQQCSSPLFWGSVLSFSPQTKSPTKKDFPVSPIERGSPPLTLPILPSFLASLVLTALKWSHCVCVTYCPSPPL